MMYNYILYIYIIVSWIIRTDRKIEYLEKNNDSMPPPGQKHVRTIPGPAPRLPVAKASDHLRCHLLCTGRFHTRWDDEGNTWEYHIDRKWSSTYSGFPVAWVTNWLCILHFQTHFNSSKIQTNIGMSYFYSFYCPYRIITYVYIIYNIYIYYILCPGHFRCIHTVS